MTLNGVITANTHYLCGSWASCSCQPHCTCNEYCYCRWWRCIRRWLGEFSPNLRQIFPNVDLLVNFALHRYRVSHHHLMN